jgi:hypothetical protein
MYYHFVGNCCIFLVDRQKQQAQHWCLSTKFRVIVAYIREMISGCRMLVGNLKGGDAIGRFGALMGIFGPCRMGIC